MPFAIEQTMDQAEVDEPPSMGEQCKPSGEESTTHTFNLAEVTFALCNALDLVGIDHHAHGKRVAIMATALGCELGWSQERIQRLALAGMLHDFGVGSSKEFFTIVHQGLGKSKPSISADRDEKQPDQATLQQAKPQFQAHCKRGWLAFSEFTPFHHIAPLILYHHTPWQTHCRTGMPDEETALLSNCIFLVDRVDVLISQKPNLSMLAYTDEVKTQINNHRETLFAPILVNAFLALANHEAFWLQLDDSRIDQRLNTHLKGLDRILSLDEMRCVAQLFAQVVDSKSPFTASHSLGVAHLARHVATLAGCSDSTARLVEIAGYLHDIGKLRIPDEILEKEGPLTFEERAIIRRHSYETHAILNSVKGFETIARWAAFHHEHPGGSGYPYGLEEEALSLESRIVSVADVFQALAQKRPYRDAMEPERILSIMKNMAVQKQLDPDLVWLMGDCLDDCMQAALPG